jgi:hypothetical protein
MEPKTALPDPQDRLCLIRDIARTGSYVFAVPGGYLFFFGMCVSAGVKSDVQNAVALFQSSGALLTISWLLLRFAVGLFPFGRRLFQ